MKLLSNEQWQLLILRVYIGLDFIHHFAEKFGLLGSKAYNDTLAYFTGLNLSYPTAVMLLAGLCEFGAFVGFTFGLFTRIAAVGTAAYLMIACVMGNHFSFGFTWANPGGGWEYPVIWSVFCLSFVITGGGKISIDNWLKNKLPKKLKFLSK